MPKEKTFPIPLKYTDATRSTRTDLDVTQEKRVDDYWNVESRKLLSDSWKGFTKFTLLNETSPKGCMWSGERLTKIQTTTRPDHVWPEVWTKIGEAAQNREKQKWAKEKPMNLFLLIQTTENTQKFPKTQEENWKDLWLPGCLVKDSQASRKRMHSRRLAMKRSVKQCMIAKWNLIESTRQRAESWQSRNHQDHIVEKEFTCMTQLQFGAEVLF